MYVRNVTFDGTNSTILPIKELGVSCSKSPIFLYNQKMICTKYVFMLDACHMLKLACNTFADKRTVVSNRGIIDFRIKRLGLSNLKKMMKMNESK